MRAVVIHHAFGEHGQTVADVQLPVEISVVDALNEVYRLTNTIDSPWWRNDHVVATPLVVSEGGCRSTSVGDRIALFEGDHMLGRWVVANVGFEQEL